MDQFWFVVEARSLAREFESEKSLFIKSSDHIENAREVSTLENCQNFPLHYDEVAMEGYDKVASDSYEHRSTHIA